MWRATIVAGVTVAVVLAVPSALGGDRFYKGTFDPQVNNDGLEFRGVIKNGEATKVYKIQWFNVPMSCQGGNTFTNDDLGNSSEKVKDGKFSLSRDINGGLTVTITGKFSDHTRKVVGTFRVQGTVNSWRHEQARLEAPPPLR